MTCAFDIKCLRGRFAMLLAVVTISMSLYGCSATQRSQMKLDNPSPGAVGVQLDNCARDADGALRRLESNGSCYVLVRAVEWHSTTNLHVEAGWVLEVDVPAGQLWFDAGRINTAPVGDDGSALMRLFGRLKRHDDERYFALMSSVVSCQAGIADQPGLLQCVDVAGHKPVRIDKSGDPLKITATGELAFYVNDAVFPVRWQDLFYWNNQGQIWIRVTRR